MCRNDENVCKDTRRKVTLFTESKTHTHTYIKCDCSYLNKLEINNLTVKCGKNVFVNKFLSKTWLVKQPHPLQVARTVSALWQSKCVWPLFAGVDWGLVSFSFCQNYKQLDHDCCLWVVGMNTASQDVLDMSDTSQADGRDGQWRRWLCPLLHKPGQHINTTGSDIFILQLPWTYSL